MPIMTDNSELNDERCQEQGDPPAVKNALLLTNYLLAYGGFKINSKSRMFSERCEATKIRPPITPERSGGLTNMTSSNAQAAETSEALLFEMATS